MQRCFFVRNNNIESKWDMDLKHVDIPPWRHPEGVVSPRDGERTAVARARNFTRRNAHTTCVERERTMDMDTELDMVDEIEPLIKQAIDATLREQTYRPTKVFEWSNSIMSYIFKKSDAIGKPFKYLISVIITQKNGAGMFTSNTMYCDTKLDSFVKVPWENATMHCIVTVYGIAIFPFKNDDLE